MEANGLLWVYWAVSAWSSFQSLGSHLWFMFTSMRASKGNIMVSWEAIVDQLSLIFIGQYFEEPALFVLAKSSVFGV